MLSVHEGHIEVTSFPILSLLCASNQDAKGMNPIQNVRTQTAPMQIWRKGYNTWVRKGQFLYVRIDVCTIYGKNAHWMQAVFRWFSHRLQFRLRFCVYSVAKHV